MANVPVPRKLTNREMKEYAVKLIEAHARDVEYLTIIDGADDYVDGGVISEFDAHLVSDLIDRAIITVSWSEVE